MHTNTDDDTKHTVHRLCDQSTQTDDSTVVIQNATDKNVAFCDNSSEEALDETHKSTKKSTPLPFGRLLVVGIILFCDSFASTSLFPYVAFMVRDFKVARDEREIGYYAGFIASAYFIGQFFSSFIWGFLSDKYGRKPILLIGLIGSLISQVMFGFSTFFSLAVIARLLCGILNGNLGVAKTYIAEITDATNQSKAFSVLGLVFGVGNICGAAVGGLLAQPAVKYPSVFGTEGFFVMFPYFLPNAVCAAITAFGLVTGLKFLTESRVFQHSKTGSRQSLMRVGSDDGEFSPLDVEMNETNASNPQSPLRSSSSEFIQSEESTDALNHIDVEGGINTSDRRIMLQKSSRGGIFVQRVKEIASNFRSLLHADKFEMLVTTTMYAGLGVIYICIDEVYPLWAVLSPEYGGLGFTSEILGMIQSIAGVFICFFQLVVSPFVLPRLGLLNSFRAGLVVLIPLVVIYPQIAWLQQNVPDWLFWTCLMITFLGRFVASQLSFTSIMVMINNSVDFDDMGKANGIGQSLVAMTRAFGPSIAGAGFAWSISNGIHFFPLDIHFVFVIDALAAVALFVASFLLTSAINKPKADSRRDAEEKKSNHMMQH